MIRGSGILLHISSLPSPYGIGTLGKEAYEFINFLASSGISYWQMLPVCVVGSANSPYQSYSSHSGNPLFIDLDFLMEEKLLSKEEITAKNWGNMKSKVDYNQVFSAKKELLEISFERFFTNDLEEFEEFCRENHQWLEDYALFMALKEEYRDIPWQDFPMDIRHREDQAIGYYRDKLWTRMDFYKFVQFKFFKQWEAMKLYAKSKGVFLIGDIPMYVSADSVDTWVYRDLFQLDQDCHPSSVAGVPPDYFSKTGQHWGNPLYRWDKMMEENFGWWKSRLAFQGMLFDVVRIDHFRGLESFWSIPRGAKTAIEGRWVKGPDLDFVNAIKDALPNLEIIAEDLGILTNEVKLLLEKSGFPGMKVLQFAFNPNENSDYLPHKHINNCIVYTGTHDNNTLKGFLDEADDETLSYIMAYLDITDKNIIDKKLIKSALSSVANVAIFQMQDLLGLGSEARMNRPSTVEDNWTWRIDNDYKSDELIKWFKTLNLLYGRIKA